MTFAVSVDRWLVMFADTGASSEKAALDAQVEQLLNRDDIWAVLQSALRDVPQDVFAIASRIILALVPSAVAETLPLPLNPPLVAAIALRIFQMDAALDAQSDSARSHDNGQELTSRAQSRRSRRRWSGTASCQPFAMRRAEVNRRADELTRSNQRDPKLADAVRRPKDWHCSACGWRSDQSYNDYLCRQCGTIRPFLSGSATMMQCRACKQWNLVFARFCEWCGKSTA